MRREPTTTEATPVRPTLLVSEGIYTFPVFVRRLVGEVSVGLDPFANQTPIEAAMAMIGRDGEPGCYSFPLADGATCHVEVSITKEVASE